MYGAFFKCAPPTEVVSSVRKHFSDQSNRRHNYMIVNK